MQLFHCFASFILLGPAGKSDIDEFKLFSTSSSLSFAVFPAQHLKSKDTRGEDGDK